MREEKMYGISRKCTSKGKESIKGVIKMTMNTIGEFNLLPQHKCNQANVQ